jgi:hypothetical protein
MKIVGDKQGFDWGEPLWRYFKTERLIAVLESSSLYFASPTQFNHPFEGAAVQPAHSSILDTLTMTWANRHADVYFI